MLVRPAARVRPRAAGREGEFVAGGHRAVEPKLSFPLAPGVDARRPHWHDGNGLLAATPTMIERLAGQRLFPVRSSPVRGRVSM